ncbi:MAG TPA: N-acetylmuramic acid 6-phosphate etherase [Bryobacteraceae bacterium]
MVQKPVVPFESLLTEQTNPASENLDALSTFEMLRVMNHEDHKVADCVGRALHDIERAVDAAAEALAHGGRMFYIGAGTSGRLGVLDASECPPTFSVPPEMIQGIMAGGYNALHSATEASEDDPALGERDLLARGFTAKDIVVGIAASGRTPYVLGAIEAAKRLGAVTIGISCTPHSQLSHHVEIAIEAAPGPEVIAGSTRLRGGTATKMVLNMLSTGVMVKLGHVYKNLMVNVQAKNEKLVARAKRIVADATGIPNEEAAKLFEESGRQVKVAIVMGKLGLAREQAEQRLSEAAGHVRLAIGE